MTDTSDAGARPPFPRVGIGAVVIKEDDVLLIKRGKPPGEGHWSLPGGSQELGETVFEGAAREVLEETRCGVEVLGLLDIADVITKGDGGEILYHYTIIDVLCRWQSGRAVAQSDALDARWFHRDTIADMDLWDEVKKNIHLGFATLDMMETQDP